MQTSTAPSLRSVEEFNKSSQLLLVYISWQFYPRDIFQCYDQTRNQKIKKINPVSKVFNATYPKLYRLCLVS